MDSVIVFFGRSTYEQIEKAAKAFGGSCNQLSRGSADVYLHRYARATWAAELDADELKLIEQFLGGPITSALEIACRHGESAHFALEVVASLMLRLSPAVLDDDLRGALDHRRDSGTTRTLTVRWHLSSARREKVTLRLFRSQQLAVLLRPLFLVARNS